jgi:hypothetical protein
MRRSKYRRANSPAWFSGRRRVVVVAVAALAAFGGVVTVTQISSASTEKTSARTDALAACDKLQASANTRLSTQTRKGTYTTNNGQVTQHADDGAGDVATTAQIRSRCRDWVTKNVSDTKATGNTNAGNTNAGNTNAGNNNAGNTNAAVATVNCPTVQVNVQVPASAKAEVDQNLALLQTQINEANARIASSQGQGGNNFIQNAVLNPLKEKRLATINRIETAIGRAAAKPNLNAEGLSTCTLNQPNAGNNNGGNNNNAGNNNGGNNNNAGNNNGGNQGNAGNNNGGNNNGGNQGNNGGNNGGAVTPPPGAGLGVLTNSCDTSQLEDHDGFQKGNRCVSTEFGEVGAAANNPTLLITNAPRQVNQNQPFTIQVSTRNLIRDRFLAAGQGGYYVESSVLQGGLVRGHFHTACRILDNRNAAPAPDPVPAFFVATEDSRGGAQPDTVAIQVPGLPQSGEFQCSSWAGDGSHRIPMMERANQTPAFDSVRIRVR